MVYVIIFICAGVIGLVFVFIQSNSDSKKNEKSINKTKENAEIKYKEYEIYDSDVYNDMNNYKNFIEVNEKKFKDKYISVIEHIRKKGILGIDIYLEKNLEVNKISLENLELIFWYLEWIADYELSNNEEYHILVSIYNLALKELYELSKINKLDEYKSVYKISNVLKKAEAVEAINSYLDSVRDSDEYERMRIHFLGIVFQNIMWLMIGEEIFNTFKDLNGIQGGVDNTKEISKLIASKVFIVKNDWIVLAYKIKFLNSYLNYFLKNLIVDPEVFVNDFPNFDKFYRPWHEDLKRDIYYPMPHEVFEAGAYHFIENNFEALRSMIMEDFSHVLSMNIELLMNGFGSEYLRNQ